MCVLRYFCGNSCHGVHHIIHARQEIHVHLQTAQLHHAHATVDCDCSGHKALTCHVDACYIATRYVLTHHHVHLHCFVLSPGLWEGKDTEAERDLCRKPDGSCREYDTRCREYDPRCRDFTLIGKRHQVSGFRTTGLDYSLENKIARFQRW